MPSQQPNHFTKLKKIQQFLFLLNSGSGRDYVDEPLNSFPLDVNQVDQYRFELMTNINSADC